jgi:hypothetical protein
MTFSTARKLAVARLALFQLHIKILKRIEIGFLDLRQAIGIAASGAISKPALS